MAHCCLLDFPSVNDAWPAGLQRELDILRALERDLPDDWLLFHGVPWEGEVEGGLRLGEWDIVAVSPAGHLAILEIKAGEVQIDEGGHLVKRYGGTTKRIGRQMRLQQHAMIGKLRQAGIDVYVGHALVLPDALGAAETAKTVKSRVLDQAALPHLAAMLQQWIRATPPDPAKVARIAAFMRDEFELALDPRAFASRVREVSRRLQGGLASTLAALELPPGGALVVDAAAGAGKTLLAGRWLDAARRRGQHWRYLCFNRPLADAMRAAWPDAQVATFHELAVEALRHASGGALDFSDPAVFARAVHALAQDGAWAEGLDGLIIDEAMDWTGEWFDAIAARLPPGARSLVLLDSQQLAYPHALAQSQPWWVQRLPQALRMRVDDNFRSPRQIVATLAALGLCEPRMLARAPIEGEPPEFFICADGDMDAMRERTEGVVASWLRAGMAPQDIALLSFTGRDKSRLLGAESLAGRRLRRFTGRFDAQGQPLWSEGELHADTVLRFKGQSAPAVVLTEVDWARFDAAARRRLYVGLTRAEWRMAVVLTQRAGVELGRLLEANG